MDSLRQFRWVLACLLAAATIATPLARARPASDDRAGSADPRAPSYFIVLDKPADLGTLLQKIRSPDVEVRTVVPAGPAGDGPAQAGTTAAAMPSVVESVRIRGRVQGDSAALTVEMAIVNADDGPTWVPIRLDGQRLIDAREGNRILDLRMIPTSRWQVQLSGRGRHRIEVQLRCTLAINPARASLAIDIPEALSTSMELDLDRREPDLIVGDNEVFGQSDLAEGRGARLSARLWPRSRVEVSWAVDSGTGGANRPILTAQGDIAVDVDSEQMRTRSTWVIRCVRGMTRDLEIRFHDRDEVTEVRLDDQQVSPLGDGRRHPGRLTIPMSEPLRPGGERRLVVSTRRPHARGEGNRVDFRGFPIVHAREQTGAIGVTQSPDLWVAPTALQGLRRIVPTNLPRDLAERPGTSLAFEFFDQPFAMALDVEPSPPLVRARARTAIRIEADRARSTATIELQWVRGRPFEIGLGLGSGLEVTSVGPPTVVEAWNLTGDGVDRPRGLTVRLSPTVRDQTKVSLQIEGFQRLPHEGPVGLGLCAPEASTAVSSSFAITADRGLSVELDDDPTRAGSRDRPTFRVADLSTAHTVPTDGSDAIGRALGLEAAGSPDVLPVRIARHPIALREETTVQARVSRRSIDVVQRTTMTVRHGTLAATTIRVPAGVGRWELRDREIAERAEVSREKGGSRIDRIRLERPIADRATLEFRWQVRIDPALDATTGRQLAIPRIAFPGAEEAPVRVELTTSAGVVIRHGDPDWTRAAVAVAAEAAEPAYVQVKSGGGHPFRFEAVALDAVPMPALLVPRLLVRSTVGLDDTVRHRASFWVEAHGPAFPFELPEGARILAARVGGRDAERVDLEGERGADRRYRLPIPTASADRPVLVELEYQLPEGPSGSSWRSPRLPDGGLVLQTLWEVRLPWDRALFGVPRGWSDEDRWEWAGNIWIRRPSRESTALDAWLVGDGSAPSRVVEASEAAPDESQRLLFGRTSGQSTDGGAAMMSARIVPRAGLIAVCSGGTLLIGFLAIFSRIRFRTAWSIAAVVGLLAAATLEPGAAIQFAQSSVMGAALTIVGVLIEQAVQRRRPQSLPVREAGSGALPARGDSSMTRAPVVGSDDPTAIRVRTPSTMDFVPNPLTAPIAPEESRSSTLGRT